MVQPESLDSSSLTKVRCLKLPGSAQLGPALMRRAGHFRSGNLSDPEVYQPDLKGIESRAEADSVK
jgi:hypothetical protein